MVRFILLTCQVEHFLELMREGTEVHGVGTFNDYLSMIEFELTENWVLLPGKTYQAVWDDDLEEVKYSLWQAEENA